MPVNYNGNPTAAQSPDTQPLPGQTIEIQLPVDGDNLNASTIYQAHKNAVDYIAYFTDPGRYMLYQENGSVQINALTTTGSFINNGGTIVGTDTLLGAIMYSTGNQLDSYGPGLTPDAIASSVSGFAVNMYGGKLYRIKTGNGTAHGIALAYTPNLWNNAGDKKAGGLQLSMSVDIATNNLSPGNLNLGLAGSTLSDFQSTDIMVQTFSGSTGWYFQSGDGYTVSIASHAPTNLTISHVKLVIYGVNTPVGAAAGNAVTELFINDSKIMRYVGTVGGNASSSYIPMVEQHGDGTSAAIGYVSAPVIQINRF